MRSKIDLVILTPGFAADEDDTTAIPSLQLLIGNMRSLYPGINIYIIAFHYPFRSGLYEWKGIPVFAAGGARWKPFKLFLWARIILHLLKLKRERGIDILHAFWLSDTALLALLLGRLTGIRVLVTAMGQDIKKQNKFLPLIRRLKPKLITISEFQAASLPSGFSHRLVEVIPFGIDSKYYNSESRVRHWDILAVGSLNEVKNYQDFIRIIKYLTGSFTGLRCGIIGEGGQRGEIERLVAQYGLQGHITLFGELPYREVITKMQESKILLHTSLFEGQGLVLTEALAAGSYVVCYPVGTAWSGAVQKIRTGATADELEHILSNILNDPNPDFSPVIFCGIEETCRRYYEIYSTLVSGKSYDSDTKSYNPGSAVL